MTPAEVQSPAEQVMEFIETLGEHMEEVFSGSPGTEKGEHYPEAGPSTTNRNAGAPDPPEYAWDEKPEHGDGEKHEHHHGHGRRGSRCRREGGDKRECGGDKRESRGANPWNRDWREAAASHPFFSAWGGEQAGFPFGPGAHGQGPHSHGGPHGHPFMGGPGRRGGFRGNPMFFGGPWGWKSNKWAGYRRGGCHGGDNNDQEFTPAIDLFDTPTAFVVHIALAGALKEDIGINYDFDNSELEISGVVHRPGDEEFLKTIVESERRVGAFERKIKLESNGKTVAVDADAITAKLENGLLEVTVPKLKRSDEPEKKKISIE